jgi:MFS family permease
MRRPFVLLSLYRRAINEICVICGPFLPDSESRFEMTAQSPTFPAPGVIATETRMISSIGAAHFLSHFYFLLLPPVFLAVRAEYDVTYTQLGLAIAVFNIVSAVFQTPAGLLADRVGPFAVLIAGLALEGLAFLFVGVVHSYWFLVAMFAVGGLANTVFHPCDYALLSHHIDGSRVGRAFSIHTFSGMFGSAAAPVAMLFLESQIGWRGAFIAAGGAGIVVTLILLLQHRDYQEGPHIAARAKAKEGEKTNKWALLMSGPIVRSFAFFTLLSATSAGIQNYSIVALHDLFGFEADIANNALTTNLLLGSIGVLVGGVLVSRVSNHSLVAAIGIGITGLAVLSIGISNLNVVMLFIIMAVGGFASGIIMPSRDMIVREVTPPGSFGTVFGFVTTGFNVSGVIFPLVFGAMMDHGSPRMVFIVSALCSLAAIVTVIGGKKQKAAVAA